MAEEVVVDDARTTVVDEPKTEKSNARRVSRKWEQDELQECGDKQQYEPEFKTTNQPLLQMPPEKLKVNTRGVPRLKTTTSINNARTARGRTSLSLGEGWKMVFIHQGHDVEPCERVKNKYLLREQTSWSLERKLWWGESGLSFYDNLELFFVLFTCLQNEEEGTEYSNTD